MSSIEEKLQAPFHPEDIEWKPQTAGISGGGKPYVLAVPYVTNRAIQKRLDEVFGALGWSNEFKPSAHEKGYLCGLTVHYEGKTVTRWDGAENTQIEPLKGGLSNSMKRAAVQFGIGRYLYQLEDMWAEKCVKCGNNSRLDGYQNIIRKGKKNNENIAWNPPALPAWALPVENFAEYSEAIAEAKTITDLKEAFQNAWKAAGVNQNQEKQEEFKNLYDIRKNHFEKVAAENIQKDVDSISAWVEARAKELSFVPNIDAVNSVYSKFQETLKNKMDGTFVDKEHFSKRLNEIYQEAIIKLKAKKGEENV